MNTHGPPPPMNGNGTMSAPPPGEGTKFMVALNTELNSMNSIAIAFIVLTWITVSLRVYVRGLMIKNFGWDDWLMLVALAFFTAFASILIALAQPFVIDGAPGSRLMSRQAQQTFQMLILYILISILIKLSLALFLLRVTQTRWQRWVIISSVSVYTVYSSAFFFVSVFQCGSPLHIRERRGEGKCLSWDTLGPLYFLHGSLNALLDWICAIIPIFILRQTRIARQAKFMVCFILGLGALGSVASIVRIVYLNGMNWAEHDYFGRSMHVTLASTIEPGLGIVAGSLATLRPLLRAIVDKSRITWNLTSGRTESTKDAATSTVQAASAGSRKRGDFASYGFTDDEEHGKMDIEKGQMDDTKDQKTGVVVTATHIATPTSSNSSMSPDDMEISTHSLAGEKDPTDWAHGNIALLELESPLRRPPLVRGLAVYGGSGATSSISRPSFTNSSNSGAVSPGLRAALANTSNSGSVSSAGGPRNVFDGPSPGPGCSTERPTLIRNSNFGSISLSAGRPSITSLSHFGSISSSTGRPSIAGTSSQFGSISSSGGRPSIPNTSRFGSTDSAGRLSVSNSYRSYRSHLRHAATPTPTWGDLGEVQRMWYERALDSHGDFRMQPNLLLPDVSPAEEKEMVMIDNAQGVGDGEDQAVREDERA